MKTRKRKLRKAKPLRIEFMNGSEIKFAGLGKSDIVMGVGASQVIINNAKLSSCSQTGPLSKTAGKNVCATCLSLKG